MTPLSYKEKAIWLFHSYRYRVGEWDRKFLKSVVGQILKAENPTEEEVNDFLSDKQKSVLDRLSKKFKLTR